MVQEICLKFDDQERFGWPEIMDSEAVLPAVEANPTSWTQRVSGDLGIS